MNAKSTNTDKRQGGQGLVKGPTPNIEHRTSNIERSRAFSLIELVGVLAVIAILASVLVPSLIRQMDRIAGEQEAAALKALGDALQQSILRNRYVPGTNDWTTKIATELGVDVASVTNNARGKARFCLIDPALQIGTNVAGEAYTQTSAGSSAPVSPRLILLSSIGRGLPGGIVSGVASSTNFNAIWNWHDRDGGLPATSFAWTGWPNGDDLKIQRVNLSPIFVRLLLSSYNSSDSPRYSIDSTNPATAVVITNNLTFVDRYFVQNSILVLHRPGTNSSDSQQILSRDTSFVYEQNVWRNSLTGGSFLAGSLDLGSIVDKYLEAPENTNAANTTVTNSSRWTGRSQQSVVVSNMIAYMNAYNAWADSNFSDNAKKATAVNIQASMKAAVQGQYISGGNPDYLPYPTLCPP